MARKLDRVMVNSLWLDAFPDFDAKFFPPERSDHCAGLLINKNQVHRRNRTFKFFNYLLEHSNFHSVIHSAWSASTVYGTQMYHLSKSLKSLRPVIRAFNKTLYEGIHSKVEVARAELQKIQADLLTSLSTSLMLQEKTQLAMLTKLIDAEESLRKQKS